ncbi:MAG: DUF1573 domain-containing protein [Candidatus Roizmanbacteria bacterium]|nr:DUF1573 domain-containing protein [Candidatus Roizmanbacteria bacterium]MCR4313492.1 DUF1573 domain-containing protein [Candidatus Roizmanbacteria bacterium]
MSKTLVIGLIIFSLVVVIGSYYFLFNGQKPQPAIISYSISDKERPKIQAKITYFDLGKMKVSDDKSADFKIKNIGQKTLQISNVSSSCNCTFGQIIIDGKESELFGMHNISDFAGEVLPGKEATVRVTYRPSIMPVYGIIEREVYISTNDPENSKLVFKVKANVN